jgi:hypothetical protein
MKFVNFQKLLIHVSLGSLRGKLGDGGLSSKLATTSPSFLSFFFFFVATKDNHEQEKNENVDHVNEEVAFPALLAYY